MIRIQNQFQQTVQRLKKKEEEIIKELQDHQKEKTNELYSIQNQHEIEWGDIDIALKKENPFSILQVKTISVIKFVILIEYNFNQEKIYSSC